MGITTCDTTVGTAQAVSFQQEVNAYRAAGGNNVVIVGNMIADEYPQASPANGGTQVYSDPYTIGGIAQSAWALHAYGYTGSDSLFQAIQNTGMPIIATESGSMVGYSGTPGGYVYWRSHNWSYSWCCWASFNNPPPTSIYPNSGNSYQYEFSISGENPWVEGNVPVGNNGTDTSQIPTGFN
jgi:hypothetical protein